jgi:non-heme chloroperoxidase
MRKRTLAVTVLLLAATFAMAASGGGEATHRSKLFSVVHVDEISHRAEKAVISGMARRMKIAALRKAIGEDPILGRKLLIRGNQVRQTIAHRVAVNGTTIFYLRWNAERSAANSSKETSMKAIVLSHPSMMPTRRDLLVGAGATLTVAALPKMAPAATTANANEKGNLTMSTITTNDGTEIFYKDWGPRDAQAIVFHHGWPLSADDWDNQMMFFLGQGFRVIAHDRRGHGRSTQTDTGNEMDTYAADVAELAEKLDLRNAIHVGHSTGGGEVVHYVARAKPGRVSKAVIIGAVPPIMVKSEKNPGGLPIEVFDGFRAALVANRAQFYRDVPAGPFYGFNRPGAQVSEGIIQNWWRQGMMGGAKAHYDCIKAFSETDFTEDLKAIDLPVLVMHGDDDQIVPYADSAPLSAKLLRNGTLKTYAGLGHGMCTINPDVVNADLLAFFKTSA